MSPEIRSQNRKHCSAIMHYPDNLDTYPLPCNTIITTRQIDFNAVGRAAALKAPAARMRYTRLRRQIESGTLIGTHGTPFASSAASEKIAKRKRSCEKENKKTVKAPEEKEKDDGDDVDAEGEMDDEVVGGSGVMLREETETKVKKEEESDGFRSEGHFEDGESDDTVSWSSEDEVPLAKLRKVKRGIPPALTQTQSQSSDAGFRAEREGAPVPEVGRESRSHIQHQTQFHPMSPPPEVSGMQQQQQHCPRSSGMAFGFPPRVMQPYHPTSYNAMRSLPTFGENFGQVYVSPYQGEWGQFESTRVGWNNGVEPHQHQHQGFAEWKPRTSF